MVMQKQEQIQQTEQRIQNVKEHLRAGHEIAEQGLDEEYEEFLRKRFRKWLEHFRKLGITISLVYHCKRCNHIWIPRDFDASFQDVFFTNKRLAHKQPPKACARCKSRYWNLAPKRKTVHTTLKQKLNPKEEIPERFKTLIEILDSNVELFGHDMLTSKRVEAVWREAKKKIIEEKLEDLRKKE